MEDWVIFSPTLNYDTRHWFEPGGWKELFLVGTAFRLGVFEGLAGNAANLSELGKKLSVDQRALSALLDALAQAGYLIKKDDRYDLTGESRSALTDKDDPAFIGFAVSHSMRLAERWITLPEVIRTGNPVVGDRFTETVEGFVKAMNVYARTSAGEVVRLCLAVKPDTKTVLDIGGATGTVGKLFAERDIKVTLFDIPEVVELVGEELKRKNIVCVGGDFNDELPTGPFDLAFLGNITHIYGPDKNKALFRRISRSLNPDGMIAILDFVKGMSPSAPFFAINMLVNTGEGGTWTENEYTAWLKEAGFGEIGFTDLKERDQQLVTGRL